MPRPKKPGAPEPKKRSRNGCWPCKGRKVKCGEEKPECANCSRNGEPCDYSFRLNWERHGKKEEGLDDDSAALDTSLEVSKLSAPPTEMTTLDGPLVSKTERKNKIFGADASITYAPFMMQSPAFQTKSQHFLLSPLGDCPDTNNEHIRDWVRSPEPAKKHVHSATNTPIIDPSLMVRRNRANISSIEGHKRSRSDMPLHPLGAMTRPKSGISSTSQAQYYSPSDSAQKDIGLLSPSITSAPKSLDFPRGSVSPGLSPPFDHTPFDHTKPLQQSPHISDSGHLRGHRDKRVRLGADKASEILLQKWTMPPPTGFVPSTNFNKPLGHPGKTLLSDVRKVSIDSLCSAAEDHKRYTQIVTRMEDARIYGHDLGLPDLDFPENNDRNAIAEIMPTTDVDDNPQPVSHRLGDTNNGISVESAFSQRIREQAFEKEGYYFRPVAIKLSISTLPPLLCENPMNLLYFHHFLNHTSCILVPHDCSDNPFKSILPQMAMTDTNLLKLLLAYSACHRACLLGHVAPANRIAAWVQDLFSSLSRALEADASEVSDANLATAIMLASLEIIYPNAFSIDLPNLPIPWQMHLNMAQQMASARGRGHAVNRKDKVSFFLYRWLAYLDVIGSLGGSRTTTSLLDKSYWTDDGSEADSEFQIDCFLGFTSRSIGLLAKIANAANESSKERLLDNGQADLEWEPSRETSNMAAQLMQDLEAARKQEYRPCPNRLSSSQAENGENSLEMLATNEAFHWAGLIHLLRRVLGVPKNDKEVQDAVGHIVGSLYKIRKGGTAEACLLFPMFTAGFYATNEAQRKIIMGRVEGIAHFGLAHVQKAMDLMEKAWETSLEWDSIVSGLFLG